MTRPTTRARRSSCISRVSAKMVGRSTAASFVASSQSLRQQGWESVRQRGSHVRLKHPDRSVFLVVPLHRELKRGTLSGILRDAGLDRDELRKLL